MIRRVKTLKQNSRDESSAIEISLYEKPISIDLDEEMGKMKNIQNEIVINQGESSNDINAYISGTTFQGTDFFAKMYIFSNNDLSDCLYSDDVFLSDESTFTTRILPDVSQSLDKGFYSVIIQVRSYSLDINLLAKISMRIKESEYVFD